MDVSLGVLRWLRWLEAFVLNPIVYNDCNPPFDRCDLATLTGGVLRGVARTYGNLQVCLLPWCSHTLVFCLFVCTEEMRGIHQQVKCVYIMISSSAAQAQS